MDGILILLREYLCQTRVNSLYATILVNIICDKAYLNHVLTFLLIHAVSAHPAGVHSTVSSLRGDFLI